MYTRSQVAATIDHAVIKPFAVQQDVVDACQLADRNGVACICVRPTDVALAARELADSTVSVGAIVGFPHGGNRSEVKAFEAQLAIEDGAVELDMVMNIGRFLSHDYDFVRHDIEAVVNEAMKRNVIVKVILETCYLSQDEIAAACRIAQQAGADYVKTSTGFGDGPATPAAIEVMLNTVGETMGVKASGGIRSFETAVGYLQQGCQRLGVASTQAVLDGAPEGPAT